MAKLGTRILIGVIFAVAVYTAFVIFSDLSLLYSKLQNFNFIVLPAALVLVFASYIVRALRWEMLLKLLHIDLPRKKSMMIFFAGLGLGITPGKLGEVIKSHFLKRESNQPISRTAPAVFVERFYDLVGIIAITIPGIWFLDVARAPLLISFAVIIAVLLLSQQRKLMVPLLQKFHNMPLLRKFANNLMITYETVYLLLSPKIYAKATAYSIAAWVIESFAVYMIFLGFNIDLSFPLVLFIFGTSSLVGAASMLPGGIGLTEGGIIGLLLLQGIDYTTAFACVLLTRIVTLWFSVIIGLVALRTASKEAKIQDNLNL